MLVQLWVVDLMVVVEIAVEKQEQKKVVMSCRAEEMDVQNQRVVMQQIVGWWDATQQAVEW